MDSDNTLSQFPGIVQNDEVRADITYEFEDEKSVYDIKKGPALRVFEVSSGGTTYVEGTDYNLVQDSDGNYTKIDWTGGDSPSAGSLFTIDQEFRSVIARYLESHDLEFGGYENDLIAVISSRQIDSAEGEELTRIGAIFGELGSRSGRSDPDYRAYLKSIVESFTGRGSRSGLKFAIAAAVGSTVDNIEIRENVEELSYTVVISNVDTEFISTSIDELADLADPSGVELEEAIIVIDGSEITIEGGSSAVEVDETGLGGGTLTLDGNSTLG